MRNTWTHVLIAGLVGLSVAAFGAEHPALQAFPAATENRNFPIGGTFPHCFFSLLARLSQDSNILHTFVTDGEGIQDV